MNDWERLCQTSLPEEHDFYSHLNVEDITDADYTLAKELVKILKQNIYVNTLIYMFKATHYS